MKNRIIIDGHDLYEEFGAVLLDGYLLNPPKRKIYEIDLSGGNGSVDLSSVLYGDSVFYNREQWLEFAFINQKNFESLKTRLSNFLHGKEADYQLTIDPGYTYHGRFDIDEYYSQMHVGKIKIKVTADPYKTKGKMTYRLDATGGRAFRFECGRKPVQPTIECTQPTRIYHNGKSLHLGIGTWRLNDVVFREGWNELYINSFEIRTTDWFEVAEGGAHQMTWVQASRLRWDDLCSISGDGLVRTKTYDDMANARWVDLAATRWRDLRYQTPLDQLNETYLTYEWSDL